MANFIAHVASFLVIDLLCDYTFFVNLRLIINGGCHRYVFSLFVFTLAYGLVMTLIIHGYLLHYYGQTVGKNAMGIRIENLYGTKADFKTIFV